MLQAHAERGLDCVFRLEKSACLAHDAFIDSSETDATIAVHLPRDAQPEHRGRSLKVRFVNCVAADTEFRLATTLLEERKYPDEALADLYRRCWKEEKFYGVGNELIGEFRGRAERGVKQEIHAAFTLIAVSRLFANRCEADIYRGSGGNALPLEILDDLAPLLGDNQGGSSASIRMRVDCRGRGTAAEAEFFSPLLACLVFAAGRVNLRARSFRKECELPGCHVTDHQTRSFMRHRKTHSTEVAGADPVHPRVGGEHSAWLG
ncbi:MAG: hypothetical protein OXI87_08815 [Albidovulum sp.]|nr:hypothetical protein [Albidovulum sp.]